MDEHSAVAGCHGGFERQEDLAGLVVRPVVELYNNPISISIPSDVNCSILLEMPYTEL